MAKSSLFSVVLAFLFSLSSFANNQVPSGPHYNLNLIGVSKGKTGSGCGDGHRIFVPLVGKVKINLSEGDFAVIDCEGTDGEAAFQLPNPDPTDSGTSTYSVYIRPLGKPGGSGSLTTCATDPSTGEEVCSTNSVTLKRTNGKPTFSNVSKELLYIDADIDGDGTIDHVPLFDDRLQGYLWDFDNNGLKVVQMRFYYNP